MTWAIIGSGVAIPACFASRNRCFNKCAGVVDCRKECRQMMKVTKFDCKGVAKVGKAKCGKKDRACKNNVNANLKICKREAKAGKNSCVAICKRKRFQKTGRAVHGLWFEPAHMHSVAPLPGWRARRNP